jgi:hypothetical protein
MRGLSVNLARRPCRREPLGVAYRRIEERKKGLVVVMDHQTPVRLFAVEGPAAIARTAAANYADGLMVEAVIEGQFFPRPNVPPAVEEDVPASFSDPEIGIAAVIDEFCSASANSAIDKTARV